MKEIHMEDVDLGEPANVGKFDIQFCSMVPKHRAIEVGYFPVFSTQAFVWRHDTARALW